MLNCVSVLYNKKNPTHSLMFPHNFMKYALSARHRHTHARRISHTHSPPHPPHPPRQPNQSKLVGSHFESQAQRLGRAVKRFAFIWVNFQKILLSLQKKRRASSGLEADRLSNINQIWSSDSFLERQIHAKRKPHSFEKRRGERTGEERIVEERRGDERRE